MRNRSRAGRMRVPLLVVALASMLALWSLVPGTAAAGPPPPSVGFCVGASLNSTHKSCKGPGPGPVTQILAEVTSGSAEICVVLNEGNGVFLGKSCGKNRASTEAFGATGFPEITDPSGASITVTGIYNT
jgi:hypothetical protein